MDHHLSQSGLLLPNQNPQVSQNGGLGSKLQSALNPNNGKQILSVLADSSTIVKSFCGLMLVGFLLSFNADAVRLLSVVPGKLMPPNYYLWTLVTSSFIEMHLVELIADMFILLLFSKMLEPLWGPLECCRFYFAVTVLCAVATTCCYIFSFAVTQHEAFLFDTRINGLGGLMGGFTVACKQIMPDTVLLNLSALGVRIKQDHLPLCVVCFVGLLCVFGLSQVSYLIMIGFGVLISWTYLRFFQVHKNGTIGDQSSTFVFASFFPSRVQPFVAICANTVFRLLVKVGVCKPAAKRYNVGGGASGSTSAGTSVSQTGTSHITITIPLVSTDNSDSERRRIKALKALKERLKKPEDEDVKTSWNENNFSDAPTSARADSENENDGSKSSPPQVPPSFSEETKTPAPTTTTATTTTIETKSDDQPKQ